VRTFVVTSVLQLRPFFLQQRPHALLCREVLFVKRLPQLVDLLSAARHLLPGYQGEIVMLWRLLPVVDRRGCREVLDALG